MRNALNEPVGLEHLYICQNIIVNVSKRLKPLFQDPFFQYCKYSHASNSFVHLYTHYAGKHMKAPTKHVTPLDNCAYMFEEYHFRSDKSTRYRCR